MKNNFAGLVCTVILLSFANVNFGQNSDFILKKYVPDYQVIKQLHGGSGFNTLTGLEARLGFYSYVNTPNHQMIYDLKAEAYKRTSFSNMQLDASINNKFYFL